MKSFPESLLESWGRPFITLSQCAAAVSAALYLVHFGRAAFPAQKKK